MIHTDTLTAERILAEPAGRQMDEWIAERVMGWTDLRMEFIRGVDCPGQDMLFGMPPAGERRDLVPWYSTDIAAAWLVVEWLRERWGRFQLAAGCVWHCGVDTSSRVWGSGETPMVAVCRAALLVSLAG